MEPPAAVLPDNDRGKTVAFWDAGGPAVRAAAEAALAGGDADVRAFLDSGKAGAELKDDRQIALQLVTAGGRELRDAAQAALDGTPEQLRAFVSGGWKAPLESDQRVQTFQLLESGGQDLKDRAVAALNGTPDDVRNFLNEGQYPARESDDRVQLFQILSTGGAATKAAATIAVNGSPADVREFLTVGQYVARARDQEYTSVTDLVTQTKQAGEQAAQQLKAAEDEADRALKAAALAKQFSAVAAKETAAAKSDAASAAGAAARAAEATQRAAEAGQAAIAAARRATNYARLAIATASQTAQASAAAERASVSARGAAADAVVNAAAAGKARDKINETNAVVQQTDLLVSVAKQVTDIGNKAVGAAQAADTASKDVEAAAASAEESAGYADQAGVSSAATRRAADAAHRSAAEGARAAKAAVGLATQATGMADAAGKLAASAKAHATAAAQAASDAAEQAGTAADAAQKSAVHAAEADTSANAAGVALESARNVQTLARSAEAEDLTGRTNDAVDQARSIKAESDHERKRNAQAVADAKKTNEEATRLAAQASAPGADPGSVTAGGRRIAVIAMGTRGPWGRSAARSALTSSDAAVQSYVREGWKLAEQQDERTRVQQVVQYAGTDRIKAAATSALTGSADQIHAFLETGQYQAALDDYQVRTFRLLESGGAGVKEAAQKALDSNTIQGFRTFLDSEQFTARENDERVQAFQLLSSGGPEVQAAAKIALESPPLLMQKFIETGQYTALRKDQLTATHVAAVERSIAEGSQVAALARQNAAEAKRVAALARGASGEAQGYANEAQAAAGDAEKAAASAKASGDKATQSAAQAAQSAVKALKARETSRQADLSAQSAAIWARASFTAAMRSADLAISASAAARRASESAHQSADEADRVWRASMITELVHASSRDSVLFEQQKAAEAYHQFIFEAMNPKTPDLSAYEVWSMGIHMGLDLGGSLPLPGASAFEGVNCGFYAVEGKLITEDAALSCAAAVPVIGEASAWRKAEKYGERGVPIFKWMTGKQHPQPPAACFVEPNSFPAGTQVVLADGTRRAIETLRIGDRVTATDPDTGRTYSRAVEDVIRTPEDREFTDITVRGTDGTVGSITATDVHPFWTENTRTWVKAADLTAGDQLRTPAGDRASILAVNHRTAPQPAYNITVTDLHSYYVAAGNTSVLVHNGVTRGLPRRPLPNWVKDGIRDVLAGRRQQHVSSGQLDFFTGRELNGPGMDRGGAYWGTDPANNPYDNGASTGTGVTTRIYSLKDGDNGYRLLERQKPGMPPQYALAIPGPSGGHNYEQLFQFDPLCV
ncbi:polymorphic toxin-type HINT domain-containing protein [Kitasatospora sp. NPDC056446]|uniref:polymorphic toxin-type HINT domain-containing protein n=1 Tax=Kitasatospora sp. NPDC056446 TaxID=3345819 RepID=UPI0036C0AF1E